MEDLEGHVRAVLELLDKQPGQAPGAAPIEIIRDSLDRMRFIVAMEERCDVFIDDERIDELVFESVQALVASFASIVQP